MRIADAIAEILHLPPSAEKNLQKSTVSLKMSLHCLWYKSLRVLQGGRWREQERLLCEGVEENGQA